MLINCYQLFLTTQKKIIVPTEDNHIGQSIHEWTE